MNRLYLFTILLLSCNIGDCFGQDTLTVMSYNIYHGEQAYEAGESNLEEIAAVIERVNPDLVALQEVDSLTGRSARLNDGQPVNQVQKLGELTGMHSYFGKAMDYDGGGYGEGILSRVPAEHKKVMLPIPAGGEPRALLIVRYPAGKHSYVQFGGTHLCHQFEENRLAQVKKMSKVFSHSDEAVIVAGDFNFTPDDSPYQQAKKNWLDAALLAGKEVPTFSYDDPAIRIDYFFLSQKKWKIIDMKVIKEPASDHMAIVMKVVI
ncbi:MAG: endonuclease [Balneolaceae bacterium]|nr:endonuclease [Balneolaceae bacterium]